MPAQLEKFKELQAKVRCIIGEKKAAELFSQSVYGIIAGSDDVANTYFGTPFRRINYDYSSYANLMLKGASSFLEVHKFCGNYLDSTINCFGMRMHVCMYMDHNKSICTFIF
jgi:hypothetical protein